MEINDAGCQNSATRLPLTRRRRARGLCARYPASGRILVSGGFALNYAFVAAMLVLSGMPIIAFADAETRQLKSHTYYYLAVSQDRRNGSWLLAWEGTIKGDITGVIRWWNDTAEAVSPNYVTRWEILDCPLLDPSACPHDPALVIMAGYSAGTNLAPVDGSTKWLGKGVVTFVSPQHRLYAKWFGRPITEGGVYSQKGRLEGNGEFTIDDASYTH